MIWGVEGRHIWTPPGGPVMIRQNWMPNPRSAVTKMLTSSAVYTNARVKWAAEGVTAAPASENEWVDLATFVAGPDTNVGYVPFTFGRGGYWLCSLYVWFPENWDGGDLVLAPEGYAATQIVTLRTASAAIKKSWQQVAFAARIESSDLVGNLVLRHTKAPSVGRKVFASSMLIERTPWQLDVPNTRPLPTYFPTAAQLAVVGAKWEGAADASTSDLLGSPITLGKIYDDAGLIIWPHYKLKAISGLFNLGESEDNADAPPGRLGEIARLSQRRGKPITYEGWINARSLRQLREADTLLRQSFAAQEFEGKMEVTPHPLNPDFPGEPPKYYEARPLGVEVTDQQDTMQYQRRFLVALRAHDPRYFDQVTYSSTINLAAVNTPVEFS